jgi:hypothetical protein
MIVSGAPCAMVPVNGGVTVVATSPLAATFQSNTSA